MLCVKIPEDREFLNYSETNNRATFKLSHVNNLSSPFWCSVWNSADCLDHGCIRKLRQL